MENAMTSSSRLGDPHGQEEAVAVGFENPGIAEVSAFQRSSSTQLPSEREIDGYLDRIQISFSDVMRGNDSQQISSECQQMNEPSTGGVPGSPSPSPLPASSFGRTSSSEETDHLDRFQIAFSDVMRGKNFQQISSECQHMCEPSTGAVPGSPACSPLQASRARFPDKVLRKKVRSFCTDTGGGVGVWFNDKIFGLGAKSCDSIMRDASFRCEIDQPTSESMERAEHDLEAPEQLSTHVILPEGFAEGRENEQNVHTRDVPFDEFVQAPEGAIAFGRIAWDNERDPVQFVRVTDKGDAALQQHLLRFFVENVWGLRRPQLQISVFGSTTEMDLKLEHQKKLAGIMQIAVETSAVVVADGIDSGVSKFLADARKSVEGAVPLVGFVPWGLVAGRQELWEAQGDGRVKNHKEKLPVEDFKRAEAAFLRRKPHHAPSVRLSPDHSHLVLVDEGGESEGVAELRASFLSAWAGGDSTMQRRIAQVLRQEGLGWQLMRLKEEGGREEGEAAAVAVCVQGGRAAVQHACAAVRSSRPLLLARGTGHAADLLADAVLVQRRLQSAVPRQRARALDDKAEGAGAARRQLSTEARFEALEGALLLGEGEIGAEREELLRRLLGERCGEEEKPGEEGRERCEALMKEIGKAYRVAGLEGEEAFAALEQVQEVAGSGLVEVVEMDEEEDLKGRMLLGVLARQRALGAEWRECLEAAVLFDHRGVMARLLERLQDGDALVSPATSKAMDRALHAAVARDRVEMVQCLLEYWPACLDASYSLKNKAAAALSAQECSWGRAKRRLTIKSSGGGKRAIRGWACLAGAAIDQWSDTAGALALGRWGELYEGAMRDEAVRRVMERARRWSGLEGMAGSLAKAEEWTRERRQKECVLRVRNLERVYRFVLGEHFWYRASELGTGMDLLLWALLLRRRPLVKLLWVLQRVPFRSILLAATFCRMWVRAMGLQGSLREELLEHADEYERMATEVQLKLMRADSKIAIETLERPSRSQCAVCGGCSIPTRWQSLVLDVLALVVRAPRRVTCESREQRGGERWGLTAGSGHGRLWKGLTGVDLAVLGENMGFVEKCCAEAFDLRWTGDIDPYEQPLGLYTTVLVCILSLGLLAPHLVVFRPPPKSEATKSGWHRMKPLEEVQAQQASFSDAVVDLDQWHEERVAGVLLQRFGSHKRTVPLHLPELSRSLQLEAAPQRASWGERLYVFSHAPVTLFVLDGTAQIFCNCLLTVHVVGSAPHGRSGGVAWAEWVLCGHFLSTAVTELTQLVLEGASEYFGSVWNWSRVLPCGLFGAGLLVNAWGPRGEDTQQSLRAAALFFMWMKVLHLLSVHKALGPLVIAFGRMRDDVLMFATIYAVLLLAFSSGMQGTGMDPPADHHEQPSNPAYGWDSWWLVRTYYQSFGEPFLEEMTTDGANLLTMAMWPVMNIMLVNLLIAVMNDTYTEVKHKSRLGWMIQMYHISKEYRSPSRLNVAMLVYDIFKFIWFRQDIDRRMHKLLANRPIAVGIRGWWEAVRIKFKKFQGRDLPAADQSETRLELERRIRELEESSLARAASSVSRRPSSCGSTSGTFSSRLPATQDLERFPSRTPDFSLWRSGWGWGWGWGREGRDEEGTQRALANLRRKLLRFKVQQKQDLEQRLQSEKHLQHAIKAWVAEHGASIFATDMEKRNRL